MAIFDRISELADSHRKPNNRLLKNLIVYKVLNFLFAMQKRGHPHIFVSKKNQLVSQ